MMEVVVTTGATGHAKLQANHHHQQTNIQFFYRPDALPVAEPTVSKQRKAMGNQLASFSLEMTPIVLLYQKITV